MLILAIEATNPNVPTPGVLLARAEGDAPTAPCRVLATRALHASGRHDDVLLPSIAGLLDTADVKPADLDEVLVSIGPGGFTATRLACVGAAVLAEVAGARVRAVETARVVVETASQDTGFKGPLVVAMASKRNSAFVTRFDPLSTSAPGPNRSIDVAAFERLLLPGDRLLFEGHLPDPMLEIAAKLGVESVPLRLTAEGLLASRHAGRTVATELLRPLYPREPDAVTQWRERYGKAPGDER